MADLYGFEPPRWDGLTTVDACKGMLDGRVRGFVSLGGNFLRAIHDGVTVLPVISHAVAFAPFSYTSAVGHSSASIRWSSSQAEDGDPLDILIIHDAKPFLGCS